MIEISLKIQKQNVKFVGFSKSAVATYFYVPRWKLGLDLGGFDPKYCDGVKHFFLTHTHADHSMYLPIIQTAEYKKVGDTVIATLPSCFVPQKALKYVESFLHRFSEMNDLEDYQLSDLRNKEFSLVGVDINNTDETKYHSIGKDLKVATLKCFHGISCVGYAFFQTKKKLKEKFRKLKGNDLKDLKLKGVEITRRVLTPLFVFCGDTTLNFFKENEKFLEKYLFPVVFVECTFLPIRTKGIGDESGEKKAFSKGHCHFNSIKGFFKKYPKTRFVLIHFSMKYKDVEIKKFFEEKKKEFPNVIPFV